MSENDKKWGMTAETRKNMRTRYRLIKITLLTLIIYATYTSSYPISAWISTSTLDDKWKVYINQMIPLILISITAIAMAVLGDIKSVEEKEGQTASPASQVQKMPAAPTTNVQAPAAPAPVVPTT